MSVLYNIQKNKSIFFTFKVHLLKQLDFQKLNLFNLANYDKDAVDLCCDLDVPFINMQLQNK